MQHGQVFITPIVQESWIKTLTENDLGRIRLCGWPAAEPGRTNEVSRVGAAAAVRLAVTVERSSDGAASAAARRAGVRRGGSASGGGRGGVNIGPTNCQMSMSIVKTRCSLIQFTHNGTYIWMQHGQVFITPIVQES